MLNLANLFAHALDLACCAGADHVQVLAMLRRMGYPQRESWAATRELVLAGAIK